MLAHQSDLLRNDRRAGARSEIQCSPWTSSKGSKQTSVTPRAQAEPVQDRIVDCASLIGDGVVFTTMFIAAATGVTDRE
jgi:hypothetical protein